MQIFLRLKVFSSIFLNRALISKWPDGAAKIFSYLLCRSVFLTHGRVALRLRDLWRTLYRLSYCAAAFSVLKVVFIQEENYRSVEFSKTRGWQGPKTSWRPLWRFSDEWMTFPKIYFDRNAAWGTKNIIGTGTFCLKGRIPLTNWNFWNDFLVFQTAWTTEGGPQRILRAVVVSWHRVFKVVGSMPASYSDSFYLYLFTILVTTLRRRIAQRKSLLRCFPRFLWVWLSTAWCKQRWSPLFS